MGMKQAKKVLMSIVLILSMMVVLIGCGSNASNSGNGGSNGSKAGGGNASDGKVYKWKIASIYNDPAAAPQYSSLGQGQQKFVDLVNEKSNGRIVVTPFYNGVLGGEKELFDKLRMGELEVFYGTLSSGTDKRFGVYSIPYLFTNLDEVEKANDPENGWLFKLSEEWLKEHDAQLLAVGAAAFRGFANSKHEVVHVGDLKDLKVRTYEDPIVSIFWESVSSAIRLPFSEVYTALQTNAVDGLEFQATSILGRKFYEVTKYYTDIDWQWISGANIVVGAKYWNELPDDLKQIVREAAIEAAKLQGQVEKEDNKKVLNELESLGMNVHRLTPEERQEWIDYSKTLEPQYKETIGAELYDEVMRLKAGQ
jgi:TRAP-type C4-dicarboxylate transport system substrate-binding protein